MSELKELFNKYGCDKSKFHSYHEVYEPFFKPFKDQPITILEVGVFHGHSTQAFLDYFPNATIYGLDVFTRVAMEDTKVFNHPRCKLLKANSTESSSLDLIKKEWGDIKFDIIIDDGRHTPNANRATFKNFKTLLKPYGQYFIEDIIPFDQYTEEQVKNHWWLKKKPKHYQKILYDKFLLTLKESKMKIDHFDLTKQTREMDSYIIRLTDERTDRLYQRS